MWGTMKIAGRYIIFIAGALLLFLSGGPAARAQNIDLNNLKPLENFTKEFSDTDFQARTVLHEETPMNDKYLSYKIRLPKDWTKSDMPAFVEKREENEKDGKKKLNSRVMGTVTKYYGPLHGYVRSRFEVRAIALDYEISARNWFIHYILSNGYALNGLTVISEKKIEGQYVVLEEDVSYIVRVRAEINGPRMVLAMYYVPDRLWDTEKQMQAWALESFAFLSPEISNLEITQTCTFLDLLQFDYPASWRLHASNIFSVDEMKAKLVNSIDDKTVNGEIEVYAISTHSDTDLAEEVKILSGRLEDRGLKVGKLIPLEGIYKPDEHVTFFKAEAYEANDAGGALLNHEFWIAVMVEKDYYYLITMITPARDVEFYRWARNIGAFKIVVESIRPS